MVGLAQYCECGLKRTSDALVVGYDGKIRVNDDYIFLALSNWVNEGALY